MKKAGPLILRILFLCAVHFCTLHPAHAAQDSSGAPGTSADSAAQRFVRYDSAEIRTRHFSAAKLRQYSGDPVFQYEKDRRPAQNAWQAFLNWLRDLIDSFTDTKTGRFVKELVFYLLIGAMLIFVNYYLRKHGLNGFLSREKAKKTAFSVLDENIHEMNFGELIEGAAAQGNYPLAVRYLYLSVLKDASDARLIDWETGKTNRDYVREFRDQKLAATFRDLTLLFEYAWYGEFTIDAELFAELRRRFGEFREAMLKKA